MNRRVGHAHTMVIYTMGGLWGVCVWGGSLIRKELMYCIAICQDLVSFKICAFYSYRAFNILQYFLDNSWAMLTLDHILKFGISLNYCIW